MNFTSKFVVFNMLGLVACLLLMIVVAILVFLGLYTATNTDRSDPSSMRTNRIGNPVASQPVSNPYDLPIQYDGPQVSSTSCDNLLPQRWFSIPPDEPALWVTFNQAARGLYGLSDDYTSVEQVCQANSQPAISGEYPQAGRFPTGQI